MRQRMVSENKLRHFRKCNRKRQIDDYKKFSVPVRQNAGIDDGNLCLTTGQHLFGFAENDFGLHHEKVIKVLLFPPGLFLCIDFEFVKAKIFQNFTTLPGHIENLNLRETIVLEL